MREFLLGVMLTLAVGACIVRAQGSDDTKKVPPPSSYMGSVKPAPSSKPMAKPKAGVVVTKSGAEVPESEFVNPYR